MRTLLFSPIVIRGAWLIGLAVGGLDCPKGRADTYIYNSGPIPLAPSGIDVSHCPKSVTFFATYDTKSGKYTASLLGHSNFVDTRTGQEVKVFIKNGIVTSWIINLAEYPSGQYNFDAGIYASNQNFGGPTKKNEVFLVPPFPGVSPDDACPYGTFALGKWTLAEPSPPSPITKEQKAEYALLASDLKVIATSLDAASILADPKNIIPNMNAWAVTKYVGDQISKNDQIFSNNSQVVGDGVELSIGLALFLKELAKTPKLLLKSNFTAFKLEALSLMIGFTSILPQVKADDPPDLNFTAVEPPQKISFLKTGNATVDSAVTDYLGYLSMSAAELHAAERYQGAGTANDKGYEDLQLKAFTKYSQLSAAMKTKLNADNVALSQSLPTVNIGNFPGGAQAIAKAFNAQCGKPLLPNLNQILLGLGLAQTAIDTGLCDIYTAVTASSINPDFQSQLSTPLP